MKKNNKVNPLTHFNNLKADAVKRGNTQLANFKKSLKKFQGDKNGSQVGPILGPTVGPGPNTSTPPNTPTPSNTSKSDNDLISDMLNKGMTPRQISKVMKAKTKVAVNPNTVIDASGKIISSGIDAFANRNNSNIGGGGFGPPFKKGGSVKRKRK
jgi:hypothetical protein